MKHGSSHIRCLHSRTGLTVGKNGDWDGSPGSLAFGQDLTYRIQTTAVATDKHLKMLHPTRHSDCIFSSESPGPGEYFISQVLFNVGGHFGDINLLFGH
jgi:hypothetical protein